MTDPAPGTTADLVQRRRRAGQPAITQAEVEAALVEMEAEGIVERHPADRDKPLHEQRWRLTEFGKVNGPAPHVVPNVIDGQHRNGA